MLESYAVQRTSMAPWALAQIRPLDPTPVLRNECARQQNRPPMSWNCSSLKIAEALGITVPLPLLGRAGEVILVRPACGNAVVEQVI